MTDTPRYNSPSANINFIETNDNLSKDLGTENAFGALVKVSQSIALLLLKHICSVMYYIIFYGFFKSYSLTVMNLDNILENIFDFYTEKSRPAKVPSS